MSEDNFSLSEYDDFAKRYGYDDFDTWIAKDFPRYSAATRAAALERWDQLAANETNLRETAKLISRRRQLDDLHFRLLQAGR